MRIAQDEPDLFLVTAMIVRARLFLIAFLALSRAAAQMPGAPILQNAWVAPGIVVAANIAGGSGGSGSTYAGAAAWAPGNARFQISAGGGIQTASGSSSRGVYGARAAVPLMQLMGGSLGVAAFAGVGGGSGNSADTLTAKSIIPAGVAVGYRRSVGAAGRGFSVYADPTYARYTGSGKSQGYFRLGVGLDAGITSRLGVTVGAESGATAASGIVGPRGTLYGLGISMKLGR